MRPGIFGNLKLYSPLANTIFAPPSINSKEPPTGIGADLIK